MSLQYLPTIATAEELVERALRRASRLTSRIRDPRHRARELSARKIQAITDNLADPLHKVVKQYPSVDRLHPFDRALLELTVDVDGFRQALGGIDWARKEVLRLGNGFAAQVRKAGTPARALAQRRKAYGRLTSVVRQVANRLDFLIAARNTLRRLPVVDPELPTAVLAGAPNVGKSSLVRALSTGRPEVRSYPFTTKGVSLGLLTSGRRRFQLIDTPGLLDRPDAQRNAAEQQGLAALDHLDPAIIFITDPTSHCGYPPETQAVLRADLRARYADRPWLDVRSKGDLAAVPEAEIPAGALAVSTESGEGVAELEEALVTLLAEMAPAQQWSAPPASDSAPTSPERSPNPGDTT